MSDTLYLITFYTQHDASYEVKVEEAIEDLLYDAFEKKEIIELCDVSDNTWVIRTADLIGYKVKVLQVADNSYLYI